MRTRLVTLLWLFAVALLGLSGDRAAHDGIVARDIVSTTHLSASILQAHHALPAGDVTSNDTVRPGHVSMHRAAPAFSKRSALAGEDIVRSRAESLFALDPAITAIADPPLIHNQARAPPA